jgi:hypothetical protein
MKTCAKSLCLLPLLTFFCGAATAGTAEPTAGKTMPAATVASADPVASPPQSVFAIPATPKEGRNPFFPRSKPDPTLVSPKADPVESATFILNGITSSPKRTVMINGRTFEAGESGEVKFQGGAKVSIQCLEIRDDAAIIVVGTQRRELRMRAGI